MKTLVLFFLSLLTSIAEAQTWSFPQVWQKIKDSSPALQASRLQTEALSESQAWAERHWWPRIYLDVRSYQTNDPGASFFALMEQRKLAAADFSPDAINHPDSHFNTRGALGLDLPLFEGGAKVAQVSMLDHSLRAQTLNASQLQLDQYAQAGFSYGAMGIWERQREKLQTLNEELARLIKSYQLSSKSNPVGYSGWLGMKSLVNRLEGMIRQSEAQRVSHQATLNEMGLKDSAWAPENLETEKLISLYLQPSAQIEKNSSYKVAALRQEAEAREKMTDMERARLRPRLGAFAESSMFNGSRDTANASMVGVYLQWNFFDPAEHGKSTEARLRAQAAARSSQAVEQQEQAEKQVSGQAFQASKAQLALLRDSDRLLSEQTKMTSTLFRNGSISALQMVEILNRRADLLSQQTEAELSLLKAATDLIAREDFEISQSISQTSEAGAAK